MKISVRMIYLWYNENVSRNKITLYTFFSSLIKHFNRSYLGLSFDGKKGIRF